MSQNQPPDWDGLLREFAKQQDAQMLANRNLTNLTNRNGGNADNMNNSHRSQSINFMGHYSDDSDDDDFEGFEEYSHRLGYLDSVTSQNLEEKIMSTTSTPASSRVSSRTMIPQPKLEKKPSTDSLISTRKKTNLCRKKSESFDSLLMLPNRTSDSFLVPNNPPPLKMPLSDRQVKSTSNPGFSPKAIAQRNTSIQLNKAQPITFKKPSLLNPGYEVPSSKLPKDLKNSVNNLDEDGSITQMVEQFIRVIKKHGEVLQRGNTISFVVKNKTNVTSEKMERISYTLRHAKKVLNLLRKKTGMDFELIDETNGSVQAAVRDSTGKYKVLPPINMEPKQQEQQKPGKPPPQGEKEKAEV